MKKPGLILVFFLIFNLLHSNIFYVVACELNAEDGESDEQVVLVSQSGTVNRIKVKDISVKSRHSR